jgi:hypothetical protein
MKPVATAGVVVPAPMVDVEEECMRALGVEEQTTIERTGEGEFRATTKMGLVRVVQQFAIEPEGEAATAMQVDIYVRPSWLGWMVRRVMPRRRRNRGIQEALDAMARAAAGNPEFGPEDFAGDEEDGG